MNRIILTTVVSAALLAATQTSLASEVTGLTSFTGGTPARALEVNGNFTAVKTAVDNNHARITTLESGAANPDISGNIRLAPSTSTAGNILKGTTPFLHDYGTENTFLGENAGNFTMTGSYNTASGASALAGNTTGFGNTATGTSTLLNNTTGFYNTANGQLALEHNTTGNYNSAGGWGALRFNTTGSSNTATGSQSLYNNTTGVENTAHGSHALRVNSSGGYNTAVGRSSLAANSIGSENTASGSNALNSNTTGSYNTAVGANALLQITTGSNNIAIGRHAGSTLNAGNYNIAIGNPGLASDSGVIRIGSVNDHIAAFIAGIRGVTTVNVNAIPVVIDSAGQLGTVSSSRRVKDDIADMSSASEVLMKLRPVTFYYKSDRNPAGRTQQYGLIAEEVAKVAPGLVAHSADGAIETVYYQHLTPMLLNEYQKQQRTIEALSSMLTTQTARLAALEKQAAEVAELRQQLTRVTAALSRMQQPDRIAAVGRQ